MAALKQAAASRTDKILLMPIPRVVTRLVGGRITTSVNYGREALCTLAYHTACGGPRLASPKKEEPGCKGGGRAPSEWLHRPDQVKWGVTFHRRTKVRSLAVAEGRCPKKLPRQMTGQVWGPSFVRASLVHRL